MRKLVGAVLMLAGIVLGGWCAFAGVSSAADQVGAHGIGGDVLAAVLGHVALTVLGVSLGLVLAIAGWRQLRPHPSPMPGPGR